MRHLLIALLSLGFIAACSEEPEQKQGDATEHTIEQAADQAASGMEAAGDEAEVVTETAEEAGDAMEQAAQDTETAMEDTAEEVEASAEKAAADVEASAEEASAEVEEAVEEVAGREPEAIYNQYCVACHAQGVAGAPKLDDAEAWQQRLDARGRDGLVQNALNGYNAMPAKGTCSDCSDEEMAATVDWMLAQAGL